MPVRVGSSEGLGVTPQTGTMLAAA